MGSSWMAERAAEELRALEAEHPDRCGLLKHELRSFIFDSGRCCFPSVPFTGPSWVVERAVEELRALEAEHPNQLGCLKLELRAFISDSLRSFPSLTPAESSNRKRRKRGAMIQRVAAGDPTGQKLREEPRPKATKDSVDMALERAEECLRKIRRVKESLANGC